MKRLIFSKNIREKEDAPCTPPIIHIPIECITHMRNRNTTDIGLLLIILTSINILYGPAFLVYFICININTFILDITI